MLQPDFIADGDPIIDGERQWGARRQDDQVVRDDFNRTRRQFRILVSLGPDGHLTGHLDAELIAERVRDRGLTHHDLGPTGGVTQVQERDPAMVTPGRDPSGKGDDATSVGLADIAGVVGSDHNVPFCDKRAPTSATNDSKVTVSWEPSAMFLT